MPKMRTPLLVLALTVALAACAGEAEVDTTTSTAPAETTTTVADTTTTEADTTTTEAQTTTTAAETTTTSGSEATGDLSAIQSALAQSSELQPARVEGLMTISGMEGAGQTTVEMPFSLSIDNETGNSAMVMDFSGMADVAGEELPPEFADMFGEFEIRTVDGVDYIKFGFLNMFMGAETEWVSTPSEGEDVAGDFGATAPDDPTAYLESFSDIEGQVEDLGREDLRGIEVTHYRVQVDSDSYLSQLSPEEREELEAQGPLPTGTFPLELWIDDDGVVHRFSMTVDGNAVVEESVGEGETFETMTMQFDFFDFGGSVSIEAPPADQVTDIESLENAFGFGTTVP